MSEDIVISGMGIVTAQGAGLDDVATNLEAGRSGVGPLRAFDATKYRTTDAYEIDDREHGSDRPWRAHEWIGSAIEEALAHAALRPGDGSSVPVLVGTGLAEQRSLELWALGRHGAPHAPPRPSDLHFRRIARTWRGLGPVYTILNACSASLYALAMGYDLLRTGAADTVLVAGADSITESMYGLLDRVNGANPTCVQPFDNHRRGVLMGEGAAAVVLEHRSVASIRGAQPLAVLLSVGTSCDATHPTAPDVDGIMRAMQTAHGAAGVRSTDIGTVFAHGTGTALNDVAEATALNRVFTGRERPAVAALKSMTGHTSGASGLMSLIIGVRARSTDRLPPVLGTSEPIEEIRGFPLVTSDQPIAPPGLTQVEAFGFGGVNAVAVMGSSPNGRRTEPPGSSTCCVVTGVGLAYGHHDVSSLLKAVREGRADPPGELDIPAVLGRRGLRYLDRGTQLALVAAQRALQDGERRSGRCYDATREGVVVSSNLVVANTVCTVAQQINDEGIRGISPMALPNASANAAAAQVAIWFGRTGLNLTLSSGASSGLLALDLACTAMRAERVDRVVLVGVEPADTVTGALTASPDGGSVAPWDGAVAVVVERREPDDLAGALAVVRETWHDTTARRPQRGEHVWFPPCGLHVSDRGAQHGDRDLSPCVGESSGATGVLQLALGSIELAGSGSHAALTAGGCWGDGFETTWLQGVAT